MHVLIPSSFTTKSDRLYTWFCIWPLLCVLSWKTLLMVQKSISGPFSQLHSIPFQGGFTHHLSNQASLEVGHFPV